MIIYQDPWLLAVNKPHQLLSVPAKDRTRPNAYDLLKTRFPDIRIVHRLDEPTSGLMIFALDGNIERMLQRQFREKETEKQYIACVAGNMPGPSGIIDLPLRADWPNRPRQLVCHAKGKSSTTRWQLIRQDKCCARLSLSPITGRTHQLRMHMAAIGHAILGDSLYAKTAHQHYYDRLFLHAYKLRFFHPILQTNLLLTARLPF